MFVYVCICICVCLYMCVCISYSPFCTYSDAMRMLVCLCCTKSQCHIHCLQYNLKYQHNILRRPLAGLALWKLLANVNSKLNLAFSGELSWTCPIFNLSTNQPAREAPLSKLLPRPLQSTFFNIKSPDWYPKIRRVNISWTGIFEKSENELKYREFFHF